MGEAQDRGLGVDEDDRGAVSDLDHQREPHRRGHHRVGGAERVLDEPRATAGLVGGDGGDPGAVALVEEDHVVEVTAIGGGQPLAVGHDPTFVVSDVQAEVERVIGGSGDAAGTGGDDRVDPEVDEVPDREQDDLVRVS